MKKQIPEQQPMILYQPEVERVTLLSILRKKYYEWAEKASARRVILHIVEIFAILFVSVAFYFPEWGLIAVMFIIAKIWKFCAVVAIVEMSMRWRMIRSIFRRAKLHFLGNQHTMNGIPKSELLHFLFETNGFKFQEVRKKFGMNQKRFTPLAAKLERLRILERDSNNARVLSGVFSREQIAEMIEKGITDNDIRVIDEPEKNLFQKKRQVKEMVEKENVAMREIRPFTIRRI
jgi:hypothetical protein